MDTPHVSTAEAELLRPEITQEEDSVTFQKKAQVVGEGGNPDGPTP